jgi:hypothetical protein
MIQLADLELHEVGNLFSRQDLSNSVFQNSIIKILCLEKYFKMLIQEKSSLSNQADVPEKLIPSTFEEETSFLNEDNMLILKRLYATYYWQLRTI